MYHQLIIECLLKLRKFLLCIILSIPCLDRQAVKAEHKLLHVPHPQLKSRICWKLCIGKINLVIRRFDRLNQNGHRLQVISDALISSNYCFNEYRSPTYIHIDLWHLLSKALKPFASLDLYLLVYQLMDYSHQKVKILCSCHSPFYCLLQDFGLKKKTEKEKQKGFI